MIEYLEAGLKPETDTDRLALLISQHTPSASEKDIRQLAGIVSSLLKTIPTNIRLINAYQAHPDCRKPLSFAFGEILRYCFDENDLLPERQFGPLGLIDDAYLLHALANLLPVYFPYATPANVDRADFNSREVIDHLLPAGILDTLDRTARSVLEISVALFGGTPARENSNGRYSGHLNINGAIALLQE